MLIAPKPACAAVLLLCAAVGQAWAERYLTVDEAQKLCFPGAVKFEEKIVRLTPEQAGAIEKRSGIKVRNSGHRLWLAQGATNLLGVVFADQVIGKHEVVDYVVAVTPDGRVAQVEILEYREHYGSEIRQAKWREQFKGKTAEARLKLNDDIYNISGATLSCRHVTEGVKRVLATFEVAVRPQLGAGGWVPDSRK